MQYYSVRSDERAKDKPVVFRYTDYISVDPMKLFIQQQKDRPQFWPKYQSR